ncbi:MAG TPA: glycosyltransferase [Steroidobacteraceae bacterium]|jgi:glycosyltransferase involved in cell wall biosynthesis
MNAARELPARDPEGRPLRIVALAANPWDGQWMNRQQLLSRLAGRHGIVYSNGPFRIWDRGKDEFRRASLFGSFEQRGDVVLDRRGRLPLRVPRFGWLDARAMQLAARRWRRQLPQSDRPLVAYLFHPTFAPLLGALRPDRIVYHAYDLFRMTPSWSSAEEANESRLLAAADLVLASSREIAADLQRRSGKQVQFLPNGVDYDLFAAAGTAAEPAELAAIPRPRIGYIGKISVKFDFDLLLELSQRRSDWQFVIVGPSDELPPADAEKMATLRARGNVHLFGFRPAEQIARFTAALDVGLMCYRLGNLWTQAIYPLKMHEYLACGIPVVSAPVPAVQEFAEVVRLAQTPAQWHDAIDAALQDRDAGASARRREVARANSWNDRVAQLDRHLRSMAGGTAAP